MAKTVFEAYNDIKKELIAANIEDVVFEAKQIIKHVTGYTNAQILANYNTRLTEFQENNITAILKQRLIRYPLQYIIGSWGFYGHSFFVGPGVLIPRSDTETVIDVCLEFLKDKENPEILDLCAGSGCIGITLAAEKKTAFVTMVEKYEEAARYIAKNISENKVLNTALVMGDVFEGTAADKKYDLIVSNPPYITDDDMLDLQPEVKFEPETALAGGEDGLKFYRAITERYKSALNNGGMLCFEVGINQAEAVAEMLNEAGFSDIGKRADMGEIDRVVFGTLNVL